MLFSNLWRILRILWKNESSSFCRCVSQSSISPIYHIVDGEWRLEDTSHYVNYFTVGIIFWGQLMQNKILLAGGQWARSKLSDMSPEAPSLARLRRPSPGISRQLKSQLSAENRITKCNEKNNIFTGVPAFLAVTAKEEMFFNMQMKCHKILLKISGLNLWIILEKNGLFTLFHFL